MCYGHKSNFGRPSEPRHTASVYHAMQVDEQLGAREGNKRGPWGEGKGFRPKTVSFQEESRRGLRGVVRGGGDENERGGCQQVVVTGSFTRRHRCADRNYSDAPLDDKERGASNPILEAPGAAFRRFVGLWGKMRYAWSTSAKIITRLTATGHLWCVEVVLLVFEGFLVVCMSIPEQRRLSGVYCNRFAFDSAMNGIAVS
ncbi:hypothetical protein MRX96_015704 [Rhipicephalus microplus]